MTLWNTLEMALIFNAFSIPTSLATARLLRRMGQ